jgi:hypothetical protein
MADLGETGGSKGAGEGTTTASAPEELVAPIKPAQPVLGESLYSDYASKQLDGSCGPLVKGYSDCYEYDFERKIASTTVSIEGDEKIRNTLKETNQQQTTNDQGVTTTTSYNDGGNLHVTQNADFNLDSIKRIPDHKESFYSFPDNLFNVLEPSINFNIESLEENCARSTSNLLYNKKRYNGSTNDTYNLDVEAIKPFPTAKFLTSNNQYVVQKMGAFSEFGDDTQVLRNDGFCFIAKIGNSSVGYPGTYGSLRIRFQVRLGTTGYTPYIFNNNIGNGVSSMVTLKPSSYHFPIESNNTFMIGEYGPENVGPLSFRYGNNGIENGWDWNDASTFYPRSLSFSRYEQKVQDGGIDWDGFNKVPVNAEWFNMYDGLSPEFILNSTHLSHRLTGLQSDSGHVDTGNWNGGQFVYSSAYTINYFTRQALLNDLQYGPLSNNTVALNVSYGNNAISKRCVDPHYYNDRTHRFVRCPDATGYNFAPPTYNNGEIADPFIAGYSGAGGSIPYSNGLHSRILHLYLNRSAYRPYQSTNQPFTGSSSERLFSNEYVLQTRAFISQTKLSYTSSGSFTKSSNLVDKYMSGFNTNGKLSNGNNQYYRRRNIGTWSGELPSTQDYPIADVMRADLGMRDYEIVVFKGELNYNIKTGVETHSAEQGDGWSEGYVEYFRFRTHRNVENDKEVGTYSINNRTDFDSGSQFGADSNTPSEQGDGSWVSPKVEELKDTNGVSIASQINFPDNDTNKGGVTVSPDGEYFVVNFSENFVHENKAALGYLKIAIIQDTIETEDAQCVEFSDDPRSSGGTGISVNPVQDETLTFVTHDETGRGTHVSRVVNGPNKVEFFREGVLQQKGTGDSQYWPIHGVNGFFLMQAEVDEHIENVAEINGISRAALYGQYTAPLLDGNKDVDLLTRRSVDPLDDSNNDGVGWGEFNDVDDPLLSRSINMGWPAVGGYVNLFTTSNWLALKMLWARYGTMNGDWAQWSYNPAGSAQTSSLAATAGNTFYGRPNVTHFYYEPWRLEVQYSVSSLVTHLDTNVGPRCPTGGDRRITFHTSTSNDLAHMPFQCGECLGLTIESEEYEFLTKYDALTRGFPEVDQENDMRSHVTIKDS